MSVKALRNFKEFTVQGLKLAQNKPFALIRYADVANNCNKRVKRIKNLVLSNAEVTGNLLRCDDSERMKFIYLLGSEIDGLNDYLDWQLFSFQMINAGQLRYDTIWEIMNSEVLEKTAAEVIALMI